MLRGRLGPCLEGVLLWTSFVNNVELIAQRLADLGAVYIHCKVDAGSEVDEETRERKAKEFHDNPSIRVMVASRSVPESS